MNANEQARLNAILKGATRSRARATRLWAKMDANARATRYNGWTEGCPVTQNADLDACVRETKKAERLERAHSALLRRTLGLP